MQTQISLVSLFELGTHRGNSRSKLNPRLKNRIYGFNKGLCVIDLVQTINFLESTAEFIYKLGQKKKQILIVGTSDHIKSFVPDFASKFNNGQMPYINNRWLGGTLTNWSTIKKTLKTLEKLENIESNKEFFKELARNEQLNLQKKKVKVDKFFGGLRNLKTNRPGAVLVLDTPTNPVAIKEAELVNIPIVALTNTSAKTLPTNLNKTIVCNINSVNSIKFITEYFADAYNRGLADSLVIKKEEVTEKKEFVNK